jgi:hypothetical protein
MSSEGSQRRIALQTSEAGLGCKPGLALLTAAGHDDSVSEIPEPKEEIYMD